MQLINYVVKNKFSFLTEGHIHKEKLKEKILNHDGSEAYYCVYDLEYDSLKHEVDTGKVDSEGKKLCTYEPQRNFSSETLRKNHYKKNPLTFAQYEGKSYPALDLVFFDFDSKNIDASRVDACKFIDGLNVKNVIIFYSGSKGFHVGVPVKYFPEDINPDKLKNLAGYYKQFYPTMDTSVFNVNRKFRLPFSRHPKTNLYKNVLTLDELQNMPTDDMKKVCSVRKVFDFTKVIEFDVEPIQALVKAVEVSKKTDKDLTSGGTLDNPTVFESFDKKKCIRALIEKASPEGERNERALRIVTDCRQTSMHRDECVKLMMKWADKNALPRAEVNNIIHNVYGRGVHYNFGCQDDIKASNCSATCKLYKMLEAEKRPSPIDLPQKEKVPLENDVAHGLLTNVFKCSYTEGEERYIGGDILKYGDERDLFRWDGKRWKHLNETDKDRIKALIIRAYNKKCTYSKVNSVFNFFVTRVPSAPSGIEMFQLNPRIVNFNNGTLHLLEKGDGTQYLEFKDHSKEDYYTNVIDGQYDPTFSEKNELLDDYLENVFKDEPDKEERINAIMEMFGGTLMPAYPRIYFLYGVSGSGKSQLAMLAGSMLGGENICKVDPSSMDGFGMESMINKSVNILTEIDHKKTISDSVIKQIEDEGTVLINRKNKAFVEAFIPRMHIFCANGLPRNFDGESDAYERRITILKFKDKFMGENKVRSYYKLIHEHSKQGVINFALKGLKRLVDQKGFYSNPTSSINIVKGWQRESNRFMLFVQEIRDGLIHNLFIGDDLNIGRSALYKIFRDWEEDSGLQKSKLGKISFYQAMSKQNFLVEDRKIYGIGEKQFSDDSHDSVPDNVATHIKVNDNL